MYDEYEKLIKNYSTEDVKKLSSFYKKANGDMYEHFVKNPKAYGRHVL